MDTHKPDELIMDAARAQALLNEGNARFVSGVLTPKDSYSADRETLAAGQKPFAVVLCCSDSRVAPEIFFDQKPGDLFVIRNAGNVVDATVLGSIEYAVQHLRTPLIAVCGHSSCGAVTAAVSGDPLPENIESIAERIRPAIQTAGDVDGTIHNNVANVVAQITADAIVAQSGTTVLGAYYDIRTGEVTWL